MGRSAPRSPALKLYLALNSAALLGAAVLMALLARSGGYSAPRLLLVGAAALLGIAAAVLVLFLHGRPAAESRITSFALAAGPRPRIILAAASAAFWCLVWLPPQYTGEAYYYFIALYPLFLCGLLFSGSALIWITTLRGSSTPWWTAYFRRQRGALVVALLVLAGLALVVLLAAQFRILEGFEPYWFGAGVPLLASQVMIALGIAVLAVRLQTWPGRTPFSADAILFLLIWVGAAAIWASRPVRPSYWITAPRPPNFEFYPFSDPATFDLASQFALIGQGIFNGVAFDRALYMSFLVYLHSFGGQNYQQLMAIQAAIFAVFPAVLYLIGRHLHGRLAGLVLAALITMRGLTSLDASAWIDTANFKHMLTDFPTAIGVALFVLLMIKWMGAPRERLVSLVWAGGVLGLTSLLRPHVLLLMASAAALAVWVYRPRWRFGFRAAALALLAFMLGVLPWLTLGPSSGSLADLYGDRLRAVIAQRFPRPTQTAAPIPTSAPYATALPEVPMPAATAPNAPAAVATAVVAITPQVDPGPPFMVDHFLHNVITSALIFPTSPQLLSVRSVVKDGELFWRPRWNGEMSSMSALLLCLFVVVVAFGVGISAQRERLRGLIPVGVLLLYLGADSFARTSGGRYIVPVDWILVVYFSIAVAEIVGAVAASQLAPAVDGGSGSSKRRGMGGTSPAAAPRAHRAYGLLPRASHPIAVLVLVLLIGGLVPLAGILFPRRYTLNEREAGMSALRLYAPAVGATEDISLFLQNPDAILTEGRLLYPLHYPYGDGEPTRHAPYAARDFPRTVLVLIGPHGLLHVVLPGGRPPAMPNASDAIVLGCRVPGQTFNLIQAIAVVLPDQQLGLVRRPAASLTCPIPEPVCDGNGNCR